MFALRMLKKMNILTNNIRFSMFVVTQTVMPNSFIACFFENDTSRIRVGSGFSSLFKVSLTSLGSTMFRILRSVYFIFCFS